MTFTVIASSATTMSYKWYHDSNVIIGATANSYTIPTAQLSNGDQGGYYVEVRNATGPVNSRTAVLTILSSNDIPVVNNDFYATQEDVPLTVPAAGILTNDSDVYPGTLTAVLVNNPNQGSVSLNNNGSLTYNPNPNSYGTDSFTYRTKDGGTTILEENSSGGNKQEIKKDDPGAQSFRHGTAGEPPYSIKKVVFRLSKKSGQNNNLNFSIGTGINSGPIAGSSRTITMASISNATDGVSFQDYDIVFTTPVGPLMAGTTYYLNFDNLPNGRDVFFECASTSTYSQGTYYKRGSDISKDMKFEIHEETFSGVATVFLNVTPANDPPQGVNDITNMLADTSVTVMVLANDSDVEGTPLTIIGTSTTNGTAVISGTTVVFTPSSNFYGTAVFNYTISDGTNSATANATVTVNPTPVSIISQPQSQTVTQGLTASLSVVAIGTASSYQWKYLGNNLAGATGATLILTNVQFVQAGNYSVTISNVAGMVASASAFLTIIPTPGSDLPMMQDLVAHLTFDGNLADTSGRGNHAAAVRAPNIVPGFIGTGGFNPFTRNGTNNYATFGSPSDLSFGTNTHFSIAFWARLPAGGWSGSSYYEPPFICNKDFSTYANVGWTLATGANGEPEWNYTEASPNTQHNYFGSAGAFGNTNWHHVAVTFQRGGNGICYLDGVPIRTSSISPGGRSIDTGLPTNIGNDGTGNYPAAYGYFTNALGNPTNGLNMDDVGIWRRVLSPAEIGAIYNLGLARQDLARVTSNDVNSAGQRITVPGPQDTDEDIALVCSSTNGNQILISGVDAGANLVEVTVSVSNGKLTLNGTTGLTFTSGDGTNDSIMTFRGTRPKINTALNGLVFTPTTNYIGAAALTVNTLDWRLVSLNIDAALKARYTFDNTNNLGQNTSPGGAYNGTVSGATTAVDGTRGKVLNFNSGNYVQIAGRFGNPANVTLAAWVNLTTAPANGSEVISLGDSVTLRLDDAGVGISNLKGFIYDGSTWRTVNFPTTLAGTGWHHVAFTFDDAANIGTLYLDGAAVVSVAISTSISYTLGANSFIGKHGNGLTQQNFTGKIDDARVYSRALNATEISYLAQDLSLGDTDSVVITVHSLNYQPVANGDAYTTFEDMPFNIPAAGVLSNDTDVNGDALTALLVSGVSQGSLNLDANGSFTYTPNTNYYGADSFTYRARDTSSTGNVATVTINITPVNDAPRAVNDTTNTLEDVSVTVRVLANDTDVEGTALTLTSASTTNGTATVSGTNVVFRAATNFFGTVVFSYVVSDGNKSSTGSVTVAVASVNAPPLANNDSYTTPEDVPRTVNGSGVLGNDTDADGDPMTAILVSTVSEGTLSFNPNGRFTYTPNTNFFGTDSFTYRPTDGMATGNVATVTISVTPVNDAPIVNNDSATVIEDTWTAINVLTNDMDPEGTLLNFTAITGTNGSYATTATNRNVILFLPSTNYNGLVAFSYTVSDGTNSTTGNVTVSVTPAYDAPAAINDSTNTPEDVSVTIEVLANDYNPDGTPLTIASAWTTNGTVIISDTNIIFTPSTNFNGTGFVFYAMSDAFNSSTGTVTVTVTPVNDAPLATDDTYTMLEDELLTAPAAGILTNDFDVDGNPLTVSLVSDVSNGTLTLNANGSFTYRPATDYNGSDSFSYIASDGQSSGNVTTVTINITPVDDPPVAVDDTALLAEDGTISIDVLLNDSDPEGNPLTITSVTSTNGTAVISGPNIVFTPATNFNGTVVFTYGTTDGNNFATGKVTVVVAPVNDGPVANNNTYTTQQNVPLVIPGSGILADDLDVEGDPFTALLVSEVSNGSLSLNPDGSFTYTPNADYNGTDSFTYRGTDGLTLGNVVTVTINVTPVDNPLRFVSQMRVTNGVRLELSGPAACFYVIEASSNLTDWFVISTNFAALGNIVVTDTTATNHNLPSRYYRAMIPAATNLQLNVNRGTK